jgi:hypothetical protein
MNLLKWKNLMKTDRIVIKKLNNILDIFTSENGWDKWARYVNVKGYLKYLRGLELSKADLQFVQEKLK